MNTSAQREIPIGSTVCEATWRIKPEHVRRVREIVTKLTAATRGEPGNLVFQAYASSEEPALIRIFEVYRDEEALDAHSKSAHFNELVLGGVVPLLEHRSRFIARTL